MNSNINLSIQSQSKKIQKTKKSSNTCYNTFDANEKRAIIMDLKKSLSKIRNLPLTNSSSEEFLEILTKVHKNDFNTILRSSLSEYFPAYDDSTEGLRIWRRRVKEWVKMIDKPQSRATLLVPPEKLNDFKSLLITELQKFTFRSLKQLRQTLYQIFHRIGKPLSDKNTCSKHWWYDFLKHNTDVKEAWESLPKRAGADLENGEEEESDAWTATETNFNNTSPFARFGSLENNYTDSAERSSADAFFDEDIVKKEEEVENNNFTFDNFPMVDLNDNFDLNFFEKQKSVSRAPSVGWEKFFCFGQRENSTFINFEEQIKGSGSFFNFNAFEF